MNITFQRRKPRANRKNFNWLILPTVVLMVALVGGCLLPQTTLAAKLPRKPVVAKNVICDNDGRATSTRNRGAYCLDDLNRGARAATWTVNTAQSTACFKLKTIGAVNKLKPFNARHQLTWTSRNAKDSLKVVYIVSCGPRKGYLRPNGVGSTNVVLSKTAGPAEEWVQSVPFADGSYNYVSVANTNADKSNPHKSYYVLCASGHANGNSIKVCNSTKLKSGWQTHWRVYTNYHA